MSRTLYKITHIETGKCYIRQTKNFEKRKLQHIRGRDKHSLVAKAIKKYGVDNFKFEILAITEDYMIDDAEQKAIRVFKSLVPDGYNLETGGCKNKQPSNQTKNKMSASAKVKVFTPEHCKAISDGHKGKKLTKEQYDKFQEGNRKRHEERLEKKRIKDSLPNVKRVLSEEHKRKISESHKGIGHTEVTRLKLSESHKGQTPPNKGKPMSEEQKKKISLAKMGNIPWNKGLKTKEKNNEKNIS